MIEDIVIGMFLGGLLIAGPQVALKMMSMKGLIRKFAKRLDELGELDKVLEKKKK